ncbi:MAG: TIGR04282 family arsenosugar biosynthesis glycosyltransferase [Acidimicrobiales bacterium]|nr:TIGR04282 family arsenosugar biosynthesis glycosyltransferase [Acidimicrobiales bacterium]
MVDGGRPALAVLAKQPSPGRVKTRLCPPCTPEEAAALARAALLDTLDAAAATPAGRHVVVLDGDADGWLPAGFDVVPQRSGGLGERLAGAVADVGAPLVVIAMDTPQVTPTLLGHALAALSRPGVDAVLGPAHDGGYWAIGLRRAVPGVFDGVPMSRPDTGTAQRRRLEQLGLGVAELPTLHDVDDVHDLRAVAAAAPGTRFARMAAALAPLLARR